MKSPGFLVAERALAQHSERLGAVAASPQELAATLTESVGRIQTAIAKELLELTGNTLPEITIGKIDRVAAAKAHKLIDLVGVHMLLGLRGAGEVLVSLDRTSALMLTDQVFGGAGEAPATLPDRLPAAANLTMTRLGAALGCALGKAFGRSGALAVARQDEVLGKLLPAREQETLHLMRAQITVGGSAPWSITILIRESEAERLLDSSGTAAKLVRHGDRRRPDSAPFGDMPMVLTATLAQLRVPVSRLAGLQPGDTLPIPIRSEIPLRLGAVEIARAQAGSDNGQIALRLTRMAWNEKEYSK